MLTLLPNYLTQEDQSLNPSPIFGTLKEKTSKARFVEDFYPLQARFWGEMSEKGTNLRRLIYQNRDCESASYLRDLYIIELQDYPFETREELLSDLGSMFGEISDIIRLFSLSPCSFQRYRFTSVEYLCLRSRGMVLANKIRV